MEIPMKTPANVYTYLSKATGDVRREDRHAALDALDRLGIAHDTGFAQFYLTYQGPFVGPRPVAELFDLTDYSGIAGALDYVRDRYGFPVHVVPLTSDESEGMFLYDTRDGAVYDYELRDHARFIAGETDARWATFTAFLGWYFDETAADA
ncbi:hypothetical protein WL67_28185 [Burkholderia ubonensis]|nr:hypothetical protein WL66_14680 [Burkholderia ubonensis]KWD68003.1 hypothetical protein WL67_28185 [Burkholderia ubonensis]